MVERACSDIHGPPPKPQGTGQLFLALATCQTPSLQSISSTASGVVQGHQPILISYAQETSHSLVGLP